MTDIAVIAGLVLVIWLTNREEVGLASKLRKALTLISLGLLLAYSILLGVVRILPGFPELRTVNLVSHLAFAKQ